MRTRIVSSLVVVCLSFLIHSPSSRSLPPPLINYQGRLMNGTNLVNDTVSMMFRIYTNAVGGAHVFEVTNLVNVVDGLYAAVIGENMAAGSLDESLDHSQVWLEVVVDGTPLSPRERILSVPYARRVHGLQLGANQSVTINPGQVNNAGDSFAVVMGGFGNSASASFTVIGGGGFNSASAMGATVGGGGDNRATGIASTVAGGNDNTAAGLNSSVGGGEENTAGGDYATVPGGRLNAADGHDSLAAGRRAKAEHQGAFVWGDSTDADVVSTNGNSVTMRASGGYRFFSDSDTTLGAELPPNATAWASISDREAKENFEAIDAAGVLGKLVAIPVTAWTYKADPNHRRYIGPVAQDFHAAFGLGDDKTISTLDADGVAFAAIQALHQLTREKDEEIKALRAELEAIKRHLGM